MTRPIARLARVLRCTEGQAYTVTIGLVLATLLAIGGVPPVLRTHSAPTPAAHTQRGVHP